MKPTGPSLRFRVFILFVALAGAVSMALCASLYVGWLRSGGADAGPFVTAALIGLFAVVAIAVGIWLLFDENVAKPADALATRLRARAHANVTTGLSPLHAGYLGELAAAADAVSTRLTEDEALAARLVLEKTEALSRERARLEEILTEIPIATILLNPKSQIVLYDGQAAEILASIAPPRLNARITSYLDADAFESARKRAIKTGRPVRFSATGALGHQSFDCSLKPLETDNGAILLIEAGHIVMPPEAPRPLVYDFDLMAMDTPGDLAQVSLDRLTFVVFDLETTGLLPHKDDVVQIGAVRVINGRIVASEWLDRYVNPGRLIPSASTKVHGIDDGMVANADPFDVVSRQFHHFCRNAVIVAHNAPFDMAFLHKSSSQTGSEWTHPVLDTVLLSATLFGMTEQHSLDSLCARLGVTIPDNIRHTALGDARATAEALVRMIPMLKARGIVTLQDAIDASRRHGRLLEDLN